MAQKETHILIAARGYLDNEVRVEKIVIDENEIGVEFDDFEEYADYILEVAADKYEQGFSEVLIIQESQLPKLLEELVRIQRVTN
jgi:hypothetical protein